MIETIVITLVLLAGIAAVLCLAACRLSSQISQLEEQEAKANASHRDCGSQNL